MKKNCKKLVKKNIEQKKYLKNGDKLYFKWKGYDNHFNSWIDRKDLIKISQCFPKPLRSFGGNINVKVDLSNYTTETDFKNV